MINKTTRLGRLAFAIVLSICMVVTLMPAMVWAEDDEEEQRNIRFIDANGTSVSAVTAFLDAQNTDIKVKANTTLEGTPSYKLLYQTDVIYNDDGEEDVFEECIGFGTTDEQGCFVLSSTEFKNLYETYTPDNYNAEYGSKTYMIEFSVSDKQGETLDSDCVWITLYEKQIFDEGYEQSNELLCGEELWIPKNYETWVCNQYFSDGADVMMSMKESPQVRSEKQDWYELENDDDSYRFVVNKDASNGLTATITATYDVYADRSENASYSIERTYTVTVISERYIFSYYGSHVMTYGEKQDFEVKLVGVTYNPQVDEYDYRDLEVTSFEMQKNSSESDGCSALVGNITEAGNFTIQANAFNPDNNSFKLHDEYTVTATYNEQNYSDNFWLDVAQRYIRVHENSFKDTITLTSGTDNNKIYIEDFDVYEYNYMHVNNGVVTPIKLNQEVYFTIYKNADEVLEQLTPGVLSLKPGIEEFDNQYGNFTVWTRFDDWDEDADAWKALDDSSLGCDFGVVVEKGETLNLPTDPIVDPSGDTTTTIDETTTEQAIDDAIINGSDIVEIEITPSTDNGDIVVEIPKNTMGLITAKTDADLVINTGEASVRLSQDTLKSLVKESKGSTIKIELEKKTVLNSAEERAAGTSGTVIEFNILADGVKVHGFDGGTVAFTVDLPSGLSASDVAAVFVNTQGMFQKAKSNVKEGKVTVTASHCSAFAITTKDNANKLIKESNKKIKKLVKKPALKKSGKYVKVSFSDSKIKKLGYSVKYIVYKSKYKTKGYKVYKTSSVKKIKCTKKGYYKTVAKVYDMDGNVITKTKLKDCKAIKK